MITSFTFKISGVAAYTDGTSGPFESSYSNGIISNPFVQESIINFSQLYTDEPTDVNALQDLLTLGASGGKYLNFIVSAPSQDKTISSWWMDISGIVSYDDETYGSYCVQYRNGGFNDVYGKVNFHAILADDSASSVIVNVMQSVSSGSTVSVPNRSPTDIAISAATIAENNEIGTVIGTFSTTDLDTGNSFTYSLVSGTGDTDNASFTIDGVSLKANAAYNFEVKSSYTIRVRSTDQGGLTTEKAFTITVTDVNENSDPTFGTLWAFGGFPNGAYNSPIQSAIGDNWKQASSSDYFGNHYIVKDDGTLWDWGCDGSLAMFTSCLEGSLNTNPTQLFSDMGSDWKQVSSSGFATAAIKNDGTLWTWGNNLYGQLGDDSDIDRSSPVQTAAGGSNWAQVSCSKWNIAAVKTDGTLWIWGSNYTGVLANGETSMNGDTGDDRSSPVQTICGGNNWSQVSVGQCNGAAVKTDGTLWTWGFDLGQLGIGGSPSSTSFTSPVQTSLGGTDWESVSVGGGNAQGSGQVTMAAVKTDGTLWLWGSNFNGAIGDNTADDRSEPTQEITSSTSWAQVITSWTHTGAIKSDGSLWLWGDNGYGELGDGTNASKFSPVQTIMGGTTWLQVSVGDYHTIAIKY